MYGGTAGIGGGTIGASLAVATGDASALAVSVAIMVIAAVFIAFSFVMRNTNSKYAIERRV